MQHYILYRSVSIEILEDLFLQRPSINMSPTFIVALKCTYECTYISVHKLLLNNAHSQNSKPIVPSSKYYINRLCHSTCNG